MLFALILGCGGFESLADRFRSPQEPLPPPLESYVDGVDITASDEALVADRGLQDLVVELAVRSGASPGEVDDEGEALFAQVIGDSLDAIRACSDSLCVADALLDALPRNLEVVPPTGCSQASVDGYQGTVAFGEFTGTCMYRALDEDGFAFDPVVAAVSPDGVCGRHATQWGPLPQLLPVDTAFDCDDSWFGSNQLAWNESVPTEVFVDRPPTGPGPYIGLEQVCGNSGAGWWTSASGAGMLCLAEHL